MEALLSLAFDNISSKDSTKTRKGLRQIEGLLAQICLSNSSLKSSAASHKRRASAITLSQPQAATSPKKLSALSEDPAFREFFRLQEGFEWNVATRLVSCLERLLGMSSSGQNDILILSALSNLQGILLLHPPSRTIFSREIYMNLLLDLLDPFNCPAIQSSTLLVLVTTLLAHPHNARAFERIDGLLTITSLFKSPNTTQSVKLKLIEFLYFYLMPETPSTPAAASAPNTAAALQRCSPSKPLGAFERRSTVGGAEGGGGGGVEEGEGTRSTEEKQRMLGRYLSNVEDLVQDLRENAPFAEMVC
ncbi:cell division control 14, SIN component [Cenococcum geophilum]